MEILATPTTTDWQIALVDGQKALISLEIEVEELATYRRLTNLLAAQLQFIATNKTRFNLLTRREKEILEHILAGCSNEAIADKLYLSCYTIKTHRKNINEKLNCKTMVELLRYQLFF